MVNKLKEITYLTVKSLKNLEIVLPEKYTTTFQNMAKKLDVNLDDKEAILKDLNEEIEHINSIVDKTSKNLNTIQESTQNAQKAIKEKDEDSLIKINKELKKMKDEIANLQEQLFCDLLTSAYNRKWLNEEYLNEDNFPNDGFIAFLDLDKFKSINDTYGHIIGDQVLKYLVKFLKNELTFPGINIIRYAGDEFILLFNKTNVTIPNVEKTMSETQNKLAKQRLKSSKIDKLQFSFSYGLTTFKKGDNIDEVLEKVDTLMYENKQKQKV